MFIYLVRSNRDVAVSSVKTGLGGATGNKGGVAIRFRLHSSTVCFVCGHLAAGQNKVSDRNSDLADIANKLSFHGDRDVWSHDYVFLFGDFNYRIGFLSNDTVRSLAARRQFKELSENDQLRLECIKAHEALKELKEKGGNIEQLPTWQRVLSSFNEGITDFGPTYKYDVFSDEYDTSEKNRTPAWTDRILWTRRPLFVEQGLYEQEQPKWNSGRLLLYNRAEVRTSDHRPVYGLFEIDLFQVDRQKMQKTFSDFLEEVGPLDGSVVVSPTSNGQPANSDDVRMILSSCGNISTMRYVNDKAIVTFSDPREAADALKLRTNTMFKFESKFNNLAWIEAISKVIETSNDDYFSLKNNKLLVEPFVPTDRSVSPFPQDLYDQGLSHVDSSGSLLDQNEPDYTKEAMLLTAPDNPNLHVSKSAGDLTRSVRAAPPPRPPPPSANKKQALPQSPSSSFIKPIEISRPSVAEVPIVNRDHPFAPRSSQFAQLTDDGQLAYQNLNINIERSESSNSGGLKMPPSMSIDEMLAISDSVGSPISPQQTAKPPGRPAQPPSRPPPPPVPSEPTGFASAASWVDDVSAPVSGGPSPPRRAPPPAPLQSVPAADPWATDNKETHDPWDAPVSSTHHDPWAEPPAAVPALVRNPPPQPAPRQEAPDPWSASQLDEAVVKASVQPQAPPPPAPRQADPWGDSATLEEGPPPPSRRPPPPPPPPVATDNGKVESVPTPAPAQPPPPPRRAPAPVPGGGAAPPPPPPRRQ